MCQKANAMVYVVADGSSPSGILGSKLEQNKFKILLEILSEINFQNSFQIQIDKFQKKEAYFFNKRQFGKKLFETHCFRGYPIVGIKQFWTVSQNIFFIWIVICFSMKKKNFSWILEAVSIMEQNPDILCMLPRGDLYIRWFTSTRKYQVYCWWKREIYLFKNFTVDIILFTRKDS